MSWSLKKTLLLIVLILSLLIIILSQGRIYAKSELSYGVTFSKKKALDLNLDWKKFYTDIFDDLGVKKIRLSAYWDEIENEENKYFWEDLDWQIKEADKRGVKIILAVGGRLPRWPECHFPVWAEELEEERREARLLKYIEETVKRYKEEPAITAWQVENEPFLAKFGNCPKLDKNFLDQEIALVKKLDERPVIVTDSGELSLWIPAAKRADIFGTTMYRDTYSAHLKRYIHYPITPAFFRFKKNLADLASEPKDWIVIELQAEPWCPVPYEEATKEDRDRTMNLTKFKEMIEFSSQTGFKEFYLWGVEWWYWEKEVNGDSLMWEEVKKLFKT